MINFSGSSTITTKTSNPRSVSNIFMSGNISGEIKTNQPQFIKIQLLSASIKIKSYIINSFILIEIILNDFICIDNILVKIINSCIGTSILTNAPPVFNYSSLIKKYYPTIIDVFTSVFQISFIFYKNKFDDFIPLIMGDNNG